MAPLRTKVAPPLWVGGGSVGRIGGDFSGGKRLSLGHSFSFRKGVGFSFGFGRPDFVGIDGEGGGGIGGGRGGGGFGKHHNEKDKRHHYGGGIVKRVEELVVVLKEVILVKLPFFIKIFRKILNIFQLIFCLIFFL